MEMQDLSTEEGKNDYVIANEPLVDAKTKEDAKPGAETEPYSDLKIPTEDIYSEAYYGGTSLKTNTGKQVERNTRLYRIACLLLTLICLVLLLVIIILSVKLQTGSPACPATQEIVAAKKQNPVSDSTCSYEQCQARFSNVQPQYRSCQQCANGWLTFEQSCFFLSTSKLSWDESQKNCSARGGSLAIINSLRVQQFLSKEGNLKYWIGLRQQSNTWTWVNKTALGESYWAGVHSGGDCGILSSESSPANNWIRAPCPSYTYYICQLQL